VLSGKSRAKCAGFENPKHEYRNPKQGPKTEAEKVQTQTQGRNRRQFGFSGMGICLDLRASDFELPGEALGSGFAGLVLQTLPSLPPTSARRTRTDCSIFSLWAKRPRNLAEPLIRFSRKLRASE
jgi:hypothetical protein